MDIVTANLKQALIITSFVFVMMMLVDYFNVLTKGRMSESMKGGLFRQYITASFLGSTPGCLGAFMNVSFYVHGLISFGAIAGGMIATSGDEAFVMLAMFPRKALILFGILFILGIISAYIIDKIAPLLRIRPCQECKSSVVHHKDAGNIFNWKEIVKHMKNLSLARFLLIILVFSVLYGFISGAVGPKIWDWKRITFVSLFSLASFIIITVPDHYLQEHIWQHIAKKHLWKVFLWSFGALLVIDIGLKFWNLEAFVKAHMLWVLLIASVIGIIPESGPHLMFVVMFAKGIIPFSVLLASSIIQDGHGMLPLLSYTLKDSLLIKVFNFIIGIGIGFLLFSFGF
ncbi:MAG: selenocysteine protein [Candidatus Omnitrophica bacterium 4484_171]|nr:MAG: selenocysteine protein [Candidatus Omnitrophica bacterium 4484_171]